VVDGAAAVMGGSGAAAGVRHGSRHSQLRKAPQTDDGLLELADPASPWVRKKVVNGGRPVDTARSQPALLDRHGPS